MISLESFTEPPLVAAVFFHVTRVVQRTWSLRTGNAALIVRREDCNNLRLAEH